MSRNPRIVRLEVRNDDFQVLESIKTNRHKRTKRGQIFVEGVAIVNQLVAARVPVEAIVHARGAHLSDWANDVILTTEPAIRYELAPELMAELSDRANPSELIVVARRPAATLADYAYASPELVVVLDRPASPGNLGSAIRSCDAFGVDLAIVTGHACDIWDPQSLRASLGAVFAVPTVAEPSPARLIEWLDSLRAAREEFRVLGTDSGGTMQIDDESVRSPVAIVFGNEATGLSQALRDYVADVVAIPMSGSVNSLNLASALSIMLYEIDRRRSRCSSTRARNERPPVRRK